MTTLAHESKLLSLDFGNFELKAFDGRVITRIRSLQTPIAKGQRALQGTDASPILELNGQRWHVGAQCRHYRSAEATVQGDKTQLAQLHLAACIPQSGTYRLVVSHHSPDEYRNFLVNALVGQHNYTRNGQPISVTVQSVEVVAEGYGAYQLARMRNYIPQRGYTVLIDLGGSTWLSTVYASSGQVIDHESHERQGTYALAVAIAKDERLSRPLQQQFGISAPNCSDLQTKS